MAAAGMAMASAAAPNGGERQANNAPCSKHPREIGDKCHGSPKGVGSIGNSTMSSTPLHRMRLETLKLAFGLFVWRAISPGIAENSLHNFAVGRTVNEVYRRNCTGNEKDTEETLSARKGSSPALTSARPPMARRA